MSQPYSLMIHDASRRARVSWPGGLLPVGAAPVPAVAISVTPAFCAVSLGWP